MQKHIVLKLLNPTLPGKWASGLGGSAAVAQVLLGAGADLEARDGEDYAFHMLAEHWDGEAPLEVWTDCKGTLGAAAARGARRVPPHATVVVVRP